MVIGNGLLARRFESFQEDETVLIFASGVSNSKTKNPDAYTREVTLLEKCLQEHPGKTLVYFSTCSIYDPDEKNSRYVQHKLAIEKIIQTTAAHYYIFRVSNVAGRSPNPNTLLNYYFYHIRNGINFDLWTTACRNIIDIDDVFFIVSRLLNDKSASGKPINVASPVNYPVREIVAAIEAFLTTKSNYIEVNKGSCFEISLQKIETILKESPVIFDSNYLSTLLKKYF